MSETALDIEHGTYATYQWHTRTGVPLCEACRAAANAYQKEWRKRNPEGRQRERDVTKANSRALWRLADLHPSQFRALVAEERWKLAREDGA